jgi:G:T/U-mismatch repair DNA glycosylase
MEHFEKPNDIELFKLPTPSPINRRLSIQDKAMEYKKQLPSL